MPVAKKIAFPIAGEIAVPFGEIPHIQGGLPYRRFNFLSGQLPANVTFARAGTAYYRGSDGATMKAANTNVPRFDYDSNGARRGLLLEGAAQNILLQSSALDVSHSLSQFSAFGSGSVANSTDVTDPLGTTTSDKIIETTANAVHIVGQNIAVAANARYTYSRFFRPFGNKNRVSLKLFDQTAATNFIEAVFDISGAGAVVGVILGGTGALLIGNCRIEKWGSWYRCVMSGQPSTAANTGIIVRVHGVANSGSTSAAYVGVATDGYYVWGGQVETGAIASSLIPTTTVAVTRAADNCSMENVGAILNDSEGTIIVNCSLPGIPAAGTNNRYLSLEAAAAPADDNVTALFSGDNGKPGAQVVDGGVSQALLVCNGSAITRGQIHKVGVGYALNNVMGTCNGAAAATDTSATMPSGLDRIFFGQIANASYLNMHLREVRYYDRRYSNPQILALTA